MVLAASNGPSRKKSHNLKRHPIYNQNIKIVKRVEERGDTFGIGLHSLYRFRRLCAASGMDVSGKGDGDEISPNDTLAGEEPRDSRHLHTDHCASEEKRIKGMGLLKEAI